MTSRITSVTIQPNTSGTGHYVLITTSVKPEPFAVGGRFSGGPIVDHTQVMAEAARWTMAMLLDRDA